MNQAVLFYKGINSKLLRTYAVSFNSIMFSFNVFSTFIATATEIPCPRGTYNPDENGESIAACRPCTAGYYCLEKTVTPTKQCDQGFYCPTNITDGVSSLVIGSYGPRQVPCPKATYTDVSQTPNVESCKTCPIGHYCREGTANPVICERGYYCPANISDPQPCPIGTYGSQTGLHYRENCTQCDKGW